MGNCTCNNFRRQRRVLWLLFTVLMTLVASHALAGQSGQEIFEQRCSTCHDLPDPDKAPPEGQGHWKERLDQMASNASLSKKEKAKVLTFLQAHEKKAETTVSRADERRVFERKCSLCHTVDRIFRIPLTAQSREHIVKRMQARAPDWISEKEVHEILEYLAQAKFPKTTPKAGPPDGKQAGSGAAATFRARCSACHTLERVYLKLEQNDATAWAHIVNRMRKKSPQWLSEDQAQQIVKYLKGLRPVGKQ